MKKIEREFQMMEEEGERNVFNTRPRQEERAGRADEQTKQAEMMLVCQEEENLLRKDDEQSQQTDERAVQQTQQAEMVPVRQEENFLRKDEGQLQQADEPGQQSQQAISVPVCQEEENTLLKVEEQFEQTNEEKKNLCLDQLRQCNPGVLHQTDPIEWMDLNREQVANIANSFPLSLESAIGDVYPVCSVP